MARKAFFQEPTVGQIKTRQRIDSSDNHVGLLNSLSAEQYLVSQTPLKPGWQDDPDDFHKHGPEVILKRFKSRREAEKSAIQGVRPLDLRRQAYEEASEKTDYSCYSSIPLIGNDRRRRRIGLVQILDGAWLYAYSERLRKKLRRNKEEFYSDENLPGIKIRAYEDAKGTAKDGCQIVTNVSSMEEGKRRYKFDFSSIPIDNTPRKLAIALGTAGNCPCQFHIYRSLRYPFVNTSETAEIRNICKHETAGTYAIEDFFLNRDDEDDKNLTPLEQSLVALPSQFMVDLYKRMMDSWLISGYGDEKERLRKPNQAEKQVLLDRVVKIYGHDTTLFSKRSRDGELGDYDWELRQ